MFYVNTELNVAMDGYHVTKLLTKLCFGKVSLWITGKWRSLEGGVHDYSVCM